MQNSSLADLSVSTPLEDMLIDGLIIHVTCLICLFDKSYEGTGFYLFTRFLWTLFSSSKFLTLRIQTFIFEASLQI